MFYYLNGLFKGVVGPAHKFYCKYIFSCSIPTNVVLVIVLSMIIGKGA